MPLLTVRAEAGYAALLEGEARRLKAAKIKKAANAASGKDNFLWYCG